MLSFDSFTYFADLLVLCLVIYPVYQLLKWPLAKRLLLSFSGAYLLFLIAPRLLMFYIVFWLVIAIIQPIVSIAGERRYPSIALGLSIIAVLAPMVIWKLWAAEFVIWFNIFFSERVNDISTTTGAIDEVRDILLPIGLSFATFRAIDLLIQTSLGLIDRLSIEKILFFGFFPPVLVIGPIIEYSEIGPRSEKRERANLGDYRVAFFSVLTGLVKIFVLAYPLELSGDVFIYFRTNSAPVIWFELILFAWFFYLNFSGFSDISIGIARLFGFKLKPNFNRPYLRTTPQDFWNNWHMSLTRFARRNVFIPLGGMRSGRQYFAVAVTMMVIALWHDISLPLVLFGIYHGTGLIVGRFVSAKRPPNPEPSWLLLRTKASMQFIYYIASLPLLLLNLESIKEFYPALLGFS